MTLTAYDVDLAIESLDEFDWDEFSYGDGPENLTVDGVEYEFEHIESNTGGEGDWETDTFIVFRVGTQTFRMTGYYQSHNGTYWDGRLTEVHSVEKTINIWEDK